MPNAYDNPAAASAFSNFLNSKDGQIQQDILYENLLPYLNDPQAKILDAACGQGWLAGRLSHRFSSIEACDSSKDLIDQAKKIYPEINFQTADLTQAIPYKDSSFDTAILNMAAHDLSDLPQAFQNINRVLKTAGQFIVTVANPYYSFPVGVWKRGIIGRLLRRKPQLKLRPYHAYTKQTGQLHNWGGPLSSYFYPLPNYMTAALTTGFNLKTLRDLGSSQDSADYDARYRLYRFPLMLLLSFEKGRE